MNVHLRCSVQTDAEVETPILSLEVPDSPVNEETKTHVQSVDSESTPSETTRLEDANLTYREKILAWIADHICRSWIQEPEQHVVCLFLVRPKLES